MLDFLLYFLGLKTWYTSFWPCKKTKLNSSYTKGNKSLKSINILKLMEDETPSPILMSYQIKKINNPDNRNLFLMGLYTFYSFIIFLILCIQPIYTIFMYIQNADIKYLSSLFSHLNLPVMYTFEKMYFRTNHLELHLKCKRFKIITIITSCIISIILNFIDITSFYNEYYWLHLFNNNVVFFSLIIVEWIYSRLVLFLFVYCFIFIMNSHISRFHKVVVDLDKNEFDFEENVCLSNIIYEITKIRNEIEITIGFYNNIISVTTILGGISLAIFIRDVFPENNFKINFEDHDRYLLHPIILYIISQLMLLINMTRYSYRRDMVLKYIKSVDFIHRFLTRVSTEKIMKKSKGNINLVTLNIIEESATTVDWLILGNMLSERWLDFTIFGISTSDGQLLKKSIAFGSTLLFIMSFLSR
jgi:hypothetical protein